MPRGPLFPIKPMVAAYNAVVKAITARYDATVTDYGRAISIDVKAKPTAQNISALANAMRLRRKWKMSRYTNDGIWLDVGMAPKIGKVRGRGMYGIGIARHGSKIGVVIGAWQDVGPA